MRRIPLRDRRGTDRLLKVSFAVFAAALLVFAVQLLAGGSVLPWPVGDESAALFGFLFLGSAAYFVHGLVYPTWHGMKGQLVAFLVYDAVLVPPYLTLSMGGGYRTNYASLAIYWLVILFSAGLAIRYLFLHPKTRAWPVEE